MRPLSSLAHELSSIQATGLSTRLALPSAPEELLPLLTRLDELLARLDTAFKRERRLGSDIAHELSAPVTELRLLAEMRLRDKRGDEGETGYREVLQIARQMEGQVHTLLAIARSEEKAQKLVAELGDAFAIRADIAKSDDIDALVKQLKVDAQ